MSVPSRPPLVEIKPYYRSTGRQCEEGSPCRAVAIHRWAPPAIGFLQRSKKRL